LAQAVELIFDRLDTMNVACIDRFAFWFAYHLSNFQFAWNWDDWSSCLSMDPLHPKPKFVRETLIKCMRLSYHQRIVDLIPESFKALMPDYPEPQNKYNLKEGSTLPGAEVANNVCELLKKRCTLEELSAAIDEVNNQDFGDGLFYDNFRIIF
jgi:nuclear cap-binding protein subunit 1